VHQSQLIIMCFNERHVLRAINHNSSCCVFTKARPSALSQLIIMLCFQRGTSLRAINHNSSSCCVFTKGTSSIIVVFSRKARPSVLSITTHHHVVFSRSVPPNNHNSSSRCSHERGTSLRAINHNSSSCCVFTKGIPPCYQSQLIVVFSRKGHVPPCYQSQLIIMLCFHESTSSVLSTQLIIKCCFHERGTSLRAINHNSSSYVVLMKGHVPPCYQSQLIITLF
jgi:hypothetical protein